jgi:DNA-binding NtrC family response regulator
LKVADTAILLVEDEPLACRAARSFLENEGFRVEIATSGSAALRLLERGNYNAVVTNLDLGDGINGLQVLDRFERVNPGKCKILISGSSVLQSACDSVGAIFLPKPIDLERLAQTLRVALRDSSSSGQGSDR